jgi:hypothetical protein
LVIATLYRGNNDSKIEYAVSYCVLAILPVLILNGIPFTLRIFLSSIVLVVSLMVSAWIVRDALGKQTALADAARAQRVP